MKTFRSDISQKEFPLHERVLGKMITPSIMSLVKKDYPEFTPDNRMSTSELNHFRERYFKELILKDIGAVSRLEEKVISSLTHHSTLTDKVVKKDEENMTSGQRIADKVASFGGSWPFIISFSVFLLLWIGFNVVFLANKGFDPYPFILLNLILSCLAAMQAPIIMMSQNRQEEKDRQRAEQDYMVNLKAEIEIRMLHEKIDHLINQHAQIKIENEE